jgi:hypothetical protein
MKDNEWIPDLSLILKKAGYEQYWMNVEKLSEGVQFLTRSELLGMTDYESSGLAYYNPES